MSAPKGKAMPIAALIGMASHPDADKGDGGDGGSRDDAKEAMQMFLDAVKDGDADAALTAFEQLHDFCSSSEGAGDEEEGEPEEEG